MLGHELTRWTIRLALVGFVLALALAAGRWNPRRYRWFRACWTTGLILFLLHIACAFEFFYRRSHAFAVERTAAKTEQLIGVAFGNGIWFSYLFALVWAADVAWSWANPTGYQQRSRAADWLLMGYLCFIAFQGAVIFERGIVQPLGVVATVALVVWTWWRSRTSEMAGLPRELHR